MMKLLNRNALGGNVVMKIDMCKAYDTYERVNWGFLLHVLSTFGIPDIFVV